MKITPPTECPSCGVALVKVNDQLFCPNKEHCPAQCSQRLISFCKRLKFKGLGPKTLETVNLESINEIPFLTSPLLISRGLTPHMADKLASMCEKRLELGITPSDFIAACSINLIGEGTARKLKISKLEDITYDACTSWGLGDKAATALTEWVTNEWPRYRDVWGPYITSKQQAECIVKKTICITGKLEGFTSRSKAEEFLRTRGIEVLSSVTKKVTHLICDEGNKNSSSYKAAIKYGIPIITFKDLIEETND